MTSSPPSFIHRSIRRTWRAVLAIVIGFGVAILAFGILSTCFSAGGSLLIWLVGIPFIALGIESARIFARVERWRATFVDRRPLVAHPYRPLPGLPRSPYGPWLRQWAEAEFLDANRWRDVVYVLILLPLAILEFMVALFLWVAAIAFVLAPLVAAGLRAAGAPRFGGEVPAGVAAAMVIGVVIGVVLIPVAASVSRGLMTLHRAVVEGLLCVDPTDALRQDVERLRGSRSAALELEASELRRIERDLHDGAQQRLVALAIDLGLAEERIETDPTSAKTLVAAARAQASQALAELRGLVRGVAPAILVDRGLVAALGAVAGSSPIPTVLGGPWSRANGSRRPSSARPISWSSNRSRTPRSTARRRAATCASISTAPAWSSRCAMTASAARCWPPVADWPGYATASRRSTVRCRSRARPADRPSYEPSSRSGPAEWWLAR